MFLKDGDLYEHGLGWIEKLRLDRMTPVEHGVLYRTVLRAAGDHFQSDSPDERVVQRIRFAADLLHPGFIYMLWNEMNHGARMNFSIMYHKYFAKVMTAIMTGAERKHIGGETLETWKKELE